MVAVDVTVHVNLASEQGVQSVPTVKLYNGKKNVADYSGARTQADISDWLFERLLPLKLEYDTKAWSRYTQSSYALPPRFVYVHADDEKPDTAKLYEAIRHKGIFAEVSIQRQKVEAFLASYQLKSLPLLATAQLGALTPINNNDIDKALKNALSTTPASDAGTKTFGGKDSAGEGDSHSTFTLLFFIVTLTGLAYFVWKKLGAPKRHLELSKTV